MPKILEKIKNFFDGTIIYKTKKKKESAKQETGVKEEKQPEEQKQTR